ncbi:MAG: COX15/CtaA family protein, partial [Pseudomonadota bacterium]|nr:COX15/CtaA family protein [Pseudomonadota bacterium]
MNPAPPPVTRQTERTPRPLALARWLLAVAALVFVMVVVGGITRLTESGLSITEWKPVSGAIPPLTQAHWSRAFELYQATPEYREVNGPAGMDLAAFQWIYFWEWLHRLLGRLVGLAFALPFAWFALRRAIPAGYGWRLGALLALGASQGALGWYMVQSGLIDRTDVSHFRLSAHLLTALFILAGLVWIALDLRQLAHGDARPARLTPLAIGAALILFIQLLLGAWVAGLDAGYVASDWPL